MPDDINFSKTNVDHEYLEFIIDLYIGFMRNFYKRAKYLDHYRWIEDEVQQKIIIGSEFQDNEDEKRPQIIVSRGDVGWANHGFDKFKSGAIDDTNTVFMDALQGVAAITHYAEKPYESSAIALLTFVIIPMCSMMFKNNGFQYVGTTTLGRTVQVKNRYFATTVLSPFRIKWEYTKKILVENIADFTIILKDEELDKTMNEILLTFT